jgi:hypothetical protein
VKSFWCGFIKRAEAFTGGGGFSSSGKGSIYGEYEFDGPLASSTNVSGENPRNQLMTDKTLLDRERNPRDFGVGNQGPVFQADSNPHLLY